MSLVSRANAAFQGRSSPARLGEAMELTLDRAEQELLLEILEEHHRELLREIAKTTHRDFRHDLQYRVELLENIVHKLEPARAPALVGAGVSTGF